MSDMLAQLKAEKDTIVGQQIQRTIDYPVPDRAVGYGALGNATRPINEASRDLNQAHSAMREVAMDFQAAQKQLAEVQRRVQEYGDMFEKLCQKYGIPPDEIEQYVRMATRNQVVMWPE